MYKPKKIPEQQYHALTNVVAGPDPGMVQRAEAAALTCTTTREFAEFLKIEAYLVKLWCRKSKHFNDAVNSWKIHRTAEVEAALAKRAIGFTKKTKRDVITKTGQLETLTIETYYPPDPTAAQFWLKNRAPKEWKDASQVDVNVTANIRQWLIDASGPLDSSETINITNYKSDQPSETHEPRYEPTQLIEQGANIVMAMVEPVAEPEPMTESLIEPALMLTPQPEPMAMPLHSTGVDQPWKAPQQPLEGSPAALSPNRGWSPPTPTGEGVGPGNLDKPIAAPPAPHAWSMEPRSPSSAKTAVSGLPEAARAMPEPLLGDLFD